ncbi:hypothetical protein TNCV_2531931 [Trichonephila clavipes]|nr:hypothetical protein TNCV_2531931 [Trichonephila clavipes]
MLLFEYSKRVCKLAADFLKIVSLILKCSTIELDKQRGSVLPPFVVTLGLCGDLSSSSTHRKCVLQLLSRAIALFNTGISE